MTTHSTTIPACPVCDRHHAIETAGHMARFGRYWCPDCGASFGVPQPWHDDDGVQVYDGPDEGGWLSMSAQCPHCGHAWEAVAPMGAFGIQCPACGKVDEAFEWRER